MTDRDAAGTPSPRSRSESLQLRLRAARRSAAFPVTVAALVALLGGVLVGRAVAPTVDDGAAAVIEQQILPLVVDADALWTAGTNGSPAVATQLQALRVDGDPDAVAPYLADWHEAYDTVLIRIVGVDVPPPVRPVQRQFISAVTLSRDAIEVLAAAVEVDDPATRRELTSEAVRLRMRAEHLTQIARAAMTDLRGSATSGVSVPPPLPSLAELR